MKLKTKSLLESLVDIAPTKESALVIESRGATIISNTISLLESIATEYGKDAADDIERRLLSSIRNKNAAKFIRGSKLLSENKK